MRLAGFILHPKVPPLPPHPQKSQPHSTSTVEKKKIKNGHKQTCHLPGRGRDTRATSSLGTPDRYRSSPLKKAERLVPCVISRNTYRETAKYTKRYYWETCRQIINLLGTIKAFRCFWLQMPVPHTHTYKPHSSLPLSDFPTPYPLCHSPQHLPFTKQTPTALLGNSKEWWGWNRW